MRRLIQLLSLAAILISFAACTIDDDYAIDNLDDSITLFEDGIEMPFGDSELMTFEKILDVNGDNGDAFLGTNENGDYLVDFSSDAYDLSFEVLKTGINTQKGVNQKKSTGVLINVAHSIDGKIDLDKELKELTYKGLDISFTNSDFTFSIDNPSPVNVHLTGDLSFFNDNGKKLCTIEMDEDDNIVLAANSNTIVDLGEKFEKAFASISELPGSYQANLNLKIESVEITSDNTYNLKAKFSLNSGISIKSSTDYTYSTTIKDFDIEDVDGMFNSVEIKFNAISTMPVDLAISSSAENNSSIQIQISDKIKAGTLSSPTSTPITVTLSGDDLSIDNLLLNIRITGTEIGNNIPMNKNQGIQLKDIQAKINGGITL